MNPQRGTAYSHWASQRHTAHLCGRTALFRPTLAATRHIGKRMSPTVTGRLTRLTSKSSCRQISFAKGVRVTPSAPTVTGHFCLPFYHSTLSPGQRSALGCRHCPCHRMSHPNRQSRQPCGPGAGKKSRCPSLQGALVLATVLREDRCRPLEIG